MNIIRPRKLRRQNRLIIFYRGQWRLARLPRKPDWRRKDVRPWRWRQRKAVTIYASGVLR